MVFEPRGAAKSTYGSVVFPSWYLGKFPDERIILTAHGTDLARRFGRRIRSVIRQPKHQRIFEHQLSADSTAADRFALTNGSELAAMGIGAGVVGTRANGIIFDDPVSGRLAAESQTQRDTLFDAYHDDLGPCLIPDGWIAMITTRWNVDDIPGRILPEDWNGDSGMFLGRDGHLWEVLCIQARCETLTDPLGRQLGEYLAPEWFPRKHWDALELVSSTWNSMCQQRPRATEGAYFTEECLLVPYLDPDTEQAMRDFSGKVQMGPVEAPDGCDMIYFILDTAVKSGQEHDGVACTFFARSGKAVHDEWPLIVVDWFVISLQASLQTAWLPEMLKRGEELALDCGAVYGFRGGFIEDRATGSLLIQQGQQPERQWPVYGITEKLVMLGKTERCVNAQPHVYAGQVKFSRYAYEKTMTWKGSTKNHLLHQVLNFTPATKDKMPDDALDTFTYGVAIGLGNAQAIG